IGSRAFARESIGDALASADGLPRATTEIMVVRDGLFLGAIWIADSVRPEAREAVQRLRQAGNRTILLTGDARSVADAVAEDLGVDEVHAELLPDQKVAIIRQLTAAGK